MMKGKELKLKTKSISVEGASLDTPLDGTISVSEPFLTPHSKKLKALISFTPRVSHFDPSNPRSGSNEFRGFFTLFWISIFIVTIQSYVNTYQSSGHPIALAFATMFSKHALSLAITDALLVASTAFSVLFAIALKNNWIDYYKSGLIIQHSFQTLLVFSAVIWTFNRHWPWVQSGFLTLHAIVCPHLNHPLSLTSTRVQVMTMKCHSYMAVNGYLQWVHSQKKLTEKALNRLIEKRGGWDNVLQEASAAKLISESPEDTSESSGDNTPQIAPDGTVTSYIDPPAANALRQRIIASQDASITTNGSSNEISIRDALNGHSINPVQSNEPHPLTSHPDPKISSIAQNLTDMRQELTSQVRNGSKPPVTWPANIGFANFADYQLIPTLVYELEYPRTERIRPVYLLEKTIATFGSFALLYTVTAHFILPLVPTPEAKQSFWKMLLDLCIPFMVAYLLLFFIIFGELIYVSETTYPCP